SAAASGGDGMEIGEEFEMVASVAARGARVLAQALDANPLVHAVSWEDFTVDTSADPRSRSPVTMGAPGNELMAGKDADEVPSGGAVRVRGDDPDACALALIDAAHMADVEITSIACTTPSLDRVRVLSETRLRGGSRQSSGLPGGGSQVGSGA